MGDQVDIDVQEQSSSEQSSEEQTVLSENSETFMIKLLLTLGNLIFIFIYLLYKAHEDTDPDIICNLMKNISIAYN